LYVVNIFCDHVIIDENTFLFFIIFLIKKQFQILIILWCDILKLLNFLHHLHLVKIKEELFVVFRFFPSLKIRNPLFFFINKILFLEDHSKVRLPWLHGLKIY